MLNSNFWDPSSQLTSQALTCSFCHSSLIFPTTVTFWWYNLSANQTQMWNSKKKCRINTQTRPPAHDVLKMFVGRFYFGELTCFFCNLFCVLCFWGELKGDTWRTHECEVTHYRNINLVPLRHNEPKHTERKSEGQRKHELFEQKISENALTIELIGAHVSTNVVQIIQYFKTLWINTSGSV